MTRLGWTRTTCAALVIATASCGGSSSPPSTSDPGGTGERISGSERLGWNQSAASAGELATFRYAAYVDNTRVELADATCGGQSGGAFPCSSRMPAMTPGAHAIELVSFVLENGAVIESGRSTALRVTLTGATAGLPPAAPAAPVTTLLTTADGIDVRLDVITTELVAPTALAVAPDGRVFVAEREGRVRIIRDGALESDPAIVIHEALMTTTSEGGLLALALDREFERTRFVYAAFTVADGEGTRKFRVVRYREVNGRLGERVILLDGVRAATRPAVALATGPDGRLYVAFDAALGTGRATAQASYSGKVLRLAADGTTPPDQAAGSPVFAADFTSPRGIDWHPATGALWVADVKRRDLEELRIVPPAGGSAQARARIALPAGTGAAGLAFYRGTLLPAFADDVFVAAENGSHLLRLSFDARDPSRVVASERLLEDAGAPIRAVAAGADGSVHVATDRAVLRLGPR
jgi:glucose/arabinose dehydrogenase